MKTFSGLGKLNLRDLTNGAIMAVLAGIALPLGIMLQNPEFNIFTVDIQQLLVVAANGAIVGFVSYIIKNLATNDEGKFGGIL